MKAGVGRVVAPGLISSTLAHGSGGSRYSRLTNFLMALGLGHRAPKTSIFGMI